MAKIRSLPDASSMGVCRIDGAGTPVGGAFRPVISCRIRSASVVLVLRFKTTDCELGGAGAPVGKPESSCAGGSSGLIVSSVMDITDEETSSLIGKALRRS